MARADLGELLGRAVYLRLAMINTYTYKGYQAKFEVEPDEEAIFVSVANARDYSRRSSYG